MATVGGRGLGQVVRAGGMKMILYFTLRQVVADKNELLNHTVITRMILLYVKLQMDQNDFTNDFSESFSKVITKMI